MKTKICTCCEEEWEEEFFCDKCSGWQDEPDDIGNDLYVDVCLNCCDCHYREYVAENPGIPVQIDDDLPF